MDHTIRIGNTKILTYDCKDGLYRGFANVNRRNVFCPHFGCSDFTDRQLDPMPGYETHTGALLHIIRRINQ